MRLYEILRLRKVIIGRDFYCFKNLICNKQTFGNKHAAWTINPDMINNNSIVYSFGVGIDISFDLALISNYNVNVYAFDPTPTSIAWLKTQNLPSKFTFYPFGLAAVDGTLKFALPENPDYGSATIIQKQTSRGYFNAEVKRLQTITELISHKRIDILKMDIEGAEYDVIDDILSTGADIKQILIEFHHRFPEVGVRKTKEAIRKLKNAGYKIFSVSDTGEEISFIKL